jgi:CO/xanthine dehydrogenase Mo-binding subunit
MLHAVFVRSPHAHACVRHVDAAPARDVAGAVAVLGPGELGAADLAPRVSGGGVTPTAWPALAREPRFCGEAVAVVVATSAYAAADAAERVRVEYDVRPACASLEQALREEAILFRRTQRHGDVDAADLRLAEARLLRERALQALGQLLGRRRAQRRAGPHTRRSCAGAAPARTAPPPALRRG